MDTKIQDSNETLTPHIINKTKKKSKGRAFQCTSYPPCSMSFTRSEHLARHIRSHTGEKPFKCQHCQKFFSRLDNLRQHRQTVHAYENFILTYPNEKLMIRVRNDEFNEVKKNLGIDENNLIRISKQSYQEDEVDVAQQLSDLRNNLPMSNPITPINSNYQSNNNLTGDLKNSSSSSSNSSTTMLSPPNSTSPHNHHLPQDHQLPPPRSSASSLLRPLQFRPDNDKRPRPIVVPEQSPTSSVPNSLQYLNTPLSGRSLLSPLSPYYNSNLHHMNYMNNQLHPPINNGNYISPYQQNFPQDIKDHKKLPLIKFRDSQNLQHNNNNNNNKANESPILHENKHKMKVSNLMNEDKVKVKDENKKSENIDQFDNGNNTAGFRLPSFKELDFR